MPSIFVTGAGKGIGRAVVERFADAGWATAGVTRAAEDVASLNELGGVFWQADATDAEAIAPIAAEFAESGLDLLVNNAGGFSYGGFRETSAETLDRLWRANVISGFTVTQALLPALISAAFLREPGVLPPAFYLTSLVVVLINLWMLARAAWDL